ncbi:MAG: hypothetical protein EZS28_003663 [Streblomastix strix]|uniref:Uncharacterized protein n=1 Tax=Streblomastix strix TaxID=222440 RepID=A0A5J4X236_9EUKA|nr:MAG: hypothetical protein EZS28_003663 [Streblomastix strix]
MQLDGLFGRVLDKSMYSLNDSALSLPKPDVSTQTLQSVLQRRYPEKGEGNRHRHMNWLGSFVFIADKSHGLYYANEMEYYSDTICHIFTTKECFIKSNLPQQLDIFKIYPCIHSVYNSERQYHVKDMQDIYETEIEEVLRKKTSSRQVIQYDYR